TFLTSTDGAIHATLTALTLPWHERLASMARSYSRGCTWLFILPLTLAGCREAVPPVDRSGVATERLSALEIGPEHDTIEPTWGRAEQPQYNAALARSADSLFVVWYDQRRDPGGDILGARVGLDGTVLDVPSRAITYGSPTEENPRVASDGHGFLVVWTDWRNDALSIYGCRIDADA